MTSKRGQPTLCPEALAAPALPFSAEEKYLPYEPMFSIYPVQDPQTDNIARIFKAHQRNHIDVFPTQLINVNVKDLKSYLTFKST